METGKIKDLHKRNKSLFYWTTCYVERYSQTFPIKGHIVNIFVFPLSQLRNSVIVTQNRQHVKKKNAHGFVSGKPYKNQAAPDWPTGILLTSSRRKGQQMRIANFSDKGHIYLCCLFCFVAVGFLLFFFFLTTL